MFSDLIDSSEEDNVFFLEHASGITKRMYEYDEFDEDDEPLAKIVRNGNKKKDQLESSVVESSVVGCESDKGGSSNSKVVDLTKLPRIVCCSSLCLSRIPTACLKTNRQFVQEMDVQSRSQYLLDWLQCHSEIKDGNTKCTFLISGMSVCLKSWLLITGIPQPTYYHVRKKFTNGCKVIARKGPQAGQTAVKSMCAMVWFESFVKNYSDKMPNTDRNTLPPCMTKEMVYGMYETYCEDNFQNSISETHFMKLWRDTMPHVIIPKRSRFTKCDTCVELKTKLEQTRDKDLRKTLQHERSLHLEKQSNERKYYYKHGKKAVDQPDLYLSIIIDAMDQAKTQLPHFLHQTKKMQGMYKLKLNLVGLIVHGVGIYGFFDYQQYSHDSNLTISCIVNTLLMMQHLPPTLYLQMDNCFGQNKNRFVIGFLCFLIKNGIFKKIKLSFLMVGHTHEDIDQVFSRFSNSLNHTNVLSMDTMISTFEKCYSPNPTGIITTEVYDVAGALQLEKITGHSRPHIFKFQKNNAGDVEIKIKYWSTDTEWTTMESTFLKGCGPVNAIEPNLEQIELGALRKDFNNFHHLMSNQDKKWWEDFLNSLEVNEEFEVPSFSSIIKKLKRKAFQTPTVAPQTGLPNQESVIEEVNVVIGKQTKDKRPQEMKLREVGDFVLLNIEHYRKEWPQLGKITEIKSDSLIQVLWYKGAKSTAWSPCTIPIQGGRGKRTNWTEDVNTDCVYFEFKCLTSAGHLPKTARDAADQFDK